jgi:hypothetical protein
MLRVGIMLQRGTRASGRAGRIVARSMRSSSRYGAGANEVWSMIYMDIRTPVGGGRRFLRSKNACVADYGSISLPAAAFIAASVRVAAPNLMRALSR